jgi:hypothetical protein
LGPEEIVRGHEDRDVALAQFAQKLAELVAGARVEAARGFVEQQPRRPSETSAYDVTIP